MTCSFTYSATTYTYRVDTVTMEVVADGEQTRLISGDMDTDFRDLELRFSVSGMWEQVGAVTKPANDLWLDALGGASIAFVPDVDDATSLTVVPDLNHSPTFSQTRRGIYLEAVELRFISNSVYQEDNATVTALADLRPHYQY